MESAKASPVDLSEETSASYSSRFHTLLSSLNASIASVSDVSQLLPLRASLAEARAMASAGAQWWVGYEMRRAQEEVRSAADSLDAADRRLQPRKRFRFRGRATAAPAQQECAQTPGERNPDEKSERTPRPTVQAAPGLNCVEIDAALVKSSSGVVVFRRGSLCGRDVLLRDLSNAKVILLDVVGAVRASGLDHCEVVAGAVAGSVHVTAARGCKFWLSCRQMRIHESFDSTFWLDVRGKPIVEGCERVQFGRAEVRFEGAGHVRAEVGLVGANRWREVQDFCWLHEGQSPNWSLIEEGGTVAIDGDDHVKIVEEENLASMA